MGRGGGYTAQTAANQKQMSRREALADQTYGFGTKAGNAIKADVVMAQREATAAAQAPDVRHPLAAFEARQRLADVEAAPIPAVAGIGPSWQAIIEKRMAEKAPPEQAGPPVPAPLRRNTAEIPADLQTPSAPVEAAPAAKTAPVAEMTAKPAATPAAPAAGRDINSLFMKATGTEFDPKSRLDLARKAELEDLLKSKPELAGKSDAQVALQWYRQMENAKRK
jgi:hypothetical protein